MRRGTPRYYYFINPTRRRELITSKERTRYVASYRWFEATETPLVFRARHQPGIRESRQSRRDRCAMSDPYLLHMFNPTN
jgi:hypothetical protein